MKHSLIIKPHDTDYQLGDGQIEFKAVTNGDWRKYFQSHENQRNPNFETDGCVLFTAQEVFDAQMDALWPTFPDSIKAKLIGMHYLDYGLDKQLHFHSSPRYIEVLTGNGTNGNSIQDGWDAIRKYGLVPWSDLPFTDQMSEQEYFSPISADLIAKGQEFLALIGGKNAIKYHWVWQNAPKNLHIAATALLQAPLCIGIAVTDQYNQPVPQDPPASQVPAHAVACMAVLNSAMLIEDHYDPYEKTLDADYPVNYCFQAVIQPIFSTTPASPSPVPVQPAPTLPPSPSNLQIQGFLYQLQQWLYSILASFQRSNLQGISDNYMSITISGFFLTALTWLLPHLGINIDATALSTTLTTIAQIIGGLLIYWGRYRQGDVTWYGTKKTGPTV